MLNYPIYPVDMYSAPVASLFWKEGGPPRYSVGGKGQGKGSARLLGNVVCQPPSLIQVAKPPILSMGDKASHLEYR